MKSYSTLLALGKKLTENSTSENEAFLTEMINDSVRTIATMRKGMWNWLEVVEEVLTVASQEGYQLPNNIRRIADLYIRIAGSGPNYTTYLPMAVFDPNRWKLILASNLGVSDWPLFYYSQEGSGKVEIQPIPASNDNIIVIRGRLNIKDLNQADYTTGTITTATNGSPTIVGSGTSWTSGMANDWIRITSTAAANGGDGFWYQIASVTNSTTLVLKKNYQGTDIVAGSATYAIGQMSPIPESYDIAPVYRAAALYWNLRDDDKRAKEYWKYYDGGYEAGFADAPGGLIGRMLEEAGEAVEGSYIPPQPLDDFMIDPNIPPRYPLTGFGP